MIPFYSIPFHSIPFHSISFHFIPSLSIPLHSIPLPCWRASRARSSPSRTPSPCPGARGGRYVLLVVKGRNSDTPRHCHEPPPGCCQETVKRQAPLLMCHGMTKTARVATSVRLLSETRAYAPCIMMTNLRQNVVKRRDPSSRAIRCADEHPPAVVERQEPNMTWHDVVPPSSCRSRTR